MALSPGTAPFPTHLQNPTDIVKWLLGREARWGRVPHDVLWYIGFASRRNCEWALYDPNLQGTIRKCPSLQYSKIWVRAQP